MRAVWVLAVNTYKEVIRDRILYALILFAILLIGLSLALGQLSFAEQARISADFGLTAIHLCAVVLAIFIGSNLVYKEIEKKTIFTILARPISRLQFILGKSLGLTLLIITMMAGISAILCFIFWLLGVPVDARFVVVLVGLLGEAIVLLGFTLLFSMISKPLLVVCFSTGIFLIGHWHQSLAYFANKADGGPLKAISWAVDHFLPDLERLNWKGLVVYDLPLEAQAKATSLAYGLLWFVVCITLTAVLFKRKDVG